MLHTHGSIGLKFVRFLHFPKPKIRSNKRIGPHSLDIYAFLFGYLLGDTHAERVRVMNGGVRFRFSKTTINYTKRLFIF